MVRQKEREKNMAGHNWCNTEIIVAINVYPLTTNKNCVLDYVGISFKLLKKKTNI